MTSPAVGGTEVWNRLVAAASLENQIAILATELQLRETEYNRANPTETPKDRVTVSPDYEAGEVNISLDLLLRSNAILISLHDAVSPHLPA